jgi:hypothetical protein
MPNGIFNLENSDITVSDYYTIRDIVSMINPRLRNDSQISEIFIRENFNNLICNIEDTDVIDEISGFKEIWNNNQIFNRKLRPHNVQNHYELVLYNIFTRVVGEGNVHVQYQINNMGHRYDFMVEHNDRNFLIEFEGIGHYKITRGNIPVYPLLQLNQFNNEDFHLVLWPYWIQRCELNLKVILGIENFGLGAIWSSNYHFGEFPWDNSYEIITSLNNQFNIDRNGSIGYIYGPETEGRNNPENPVVANILNPHRVAWTVESKLIPHGTPMGNRNYWLPEILRNNGL